MAKAKTSEPKQRRGSAPAAEPKPKAAKAKPKQTEIPGAIKRIPEIERQAEVYVEARDARMECTEEEVKQKEKLHDLMRKHDLRVYRLDEDRVVEIVVEAESIKVRKAPVPKSGKVDGEQQAAE